MKKPKFGGNIHTRRSEQTTVTSWSDAREFASVLHVQFTRAMLSARRVSTLRSALVAVQEMVHEL